MSLKGIVIGATGGFYKVLADDEVFSCSIRGKLKKREEPGILVGDRVEVKLQDSSYVIEEIEPRSTRLIRPAIANVDQVLVVTSVRHPSPNLMLTDRITVLAQVSGIRPSICVNKIDLDCREKADEILANYDNTGYKLLKVSTVSREGLTDLLDVLCGHVTVLAGPSGSGKSAIINMVCPDYNLATGSLSQKIERGRHTTREVKLLPLSGGGFIADAPGFSVLDLNFTDEKDVETAFPEVMRYSGECRFTGCIHDLEPDCAVKDAVSNGLITARRYKMYKLCLEEARTARKNMYK